MFNRNKGLNPRDFPHSFWYENGARNPSPEKEQNIPISKYPNKQPVIMHVETLISFLKLNLLLFKELLFSLTKINDPIDEKIVCIIVALVKDKNM